MDKETTRRPTALITGASNGIGYELAKRFAQDRVGLVLVARSGEKLATVSNELRSLRAPKVEVVVADLARADSVPTLLRELSVLRLEIDVLVTNAGYGQSGTFARTDEATERGMIQLNIGALAEELAGTGSSPAAVGGRYRYPPEWHGACACRERARVRPPGVHCRRIRPAESGSPQGRRFYGTFQRG